MSKEIKVLLWIFVIIVLPLTAYWYYQNKEDKSLIDENILKWVKEHANNPESYQPIKTEILDTLYFSEKIDMQIENEKSTYESDKSELDFLRRYGGQSYKEYYKRVKEGEYNIKLLKERKDSLLLSNNPKAITGYIFIHQCRAMVPLGGLMLKNLNVLTDEKLNIISVNEDNPLKGLY